MGGSYCLLAVSLKQTTEDKEAQRKRETLRIAIPSGEKRSLVVLFFIAIHANGCPVNPNASHHAMDLPRGYLLLRDCSGKVRRCCGTKARHSLLRTRVHFSGPSIL